MAVKEWRGRVGGCIARNTVMLADLGRVAFKMGCVAYVAPELSFNGLWGGRQVPGGAGPLRPLGQSVTAAGGKRSVPDEPQLRAATA